MTLGMSGLASLVYFELILKETTNQSNFSLKKYGLEINVQITSVYDRGWANIAGWASSGVAIVTFIFACIMACVTPEVTTHVQQQQQSRGTPAANNYPMVYGVHNNHNGNPNYESVNPIEKNQTYNGVIQEFNATQSSAH